MEPEFYAWDWFIQLFMGIFPASQSFIIIDMILSVDSGDFILICLSVAILDELRSILMASGFEKTMSIFKEIDDNIPIVDFATVLRKTFLIFTTLPRSVQHEFQQIDELIANDEICEGYDYSSYPFLYDISSEELMKLRATDLKNLVFIDCYNVLKTRTEECYGVQGAVIHNYPVDILIDSEYQQRQNEIFYSLTVHKYRVIVIVVKPSESDFVCQTILNEFLKHGFYRRFIFRVQVVMRADV